jgi:methenyltetrahydrofolate cyclohydrolase
VKTLDAYLERLASNDPVPGGGSAAAVVGAIGAALVAMVGRFLAVPIAGLVDEAARLQAELREAALRDETAFTAVVAAQALPRRNEAEKNARRAALENALHRAAEEPLRAAALSLQVLKLTLRFLERDTAALASDVACAAEFAAAALTGCAYNVRVNHRYMRDESVIAQQAATLESYETEAAPISERVRAAVRDALYRRS